MSKKYCKKSSMQAVADEVKERAGYYSGTTIQGNSIDFVIERLELPVQKGAPEVILTAQSPSYEAEGGKYTGGSVSVVPQNATATLSQNGGYVPVESGKTLASVKVPALNIRRVHYGRFKPSSGATSITIDSLPFKPLGIFLNFTESTTQNSPKIISFAYDNGSVYGRAVSTTRAGGNITEASVSRTTTAPYSISITNIKAAEGSTHSVYAANFIGNFYVYVIWG